MGHKEKRLMVTRKCGVKVNRIFVRVLLKKEMRSDFIKPSWPETKEILPLFGG